MTGSKSNPPIEAEQTNLHGASEVIRHTRAMQIRLLLLLLLLLLFLWSFYWSYYVSHPSTLW